MKIIKKCKMYIVKQASEGMMFIDDKNKNWSKFIVVDVRSDSTILRTNCITQAKNWCRDIDECHREALIIDEICSFKSSWVGTE